MKPLSAIFILTNGHRIDLLSVCKRWNVSVHSFLLAVIENFPWEKKKKVSWMQGEVHKFYISYRSAKIPPTIIFATKAIWYFFWFGNAKYQASSSQQHQVKESNTLMTAFLPILSGNEIDYLDVLSFVGMDNVISLSNIDKCSILLESTLPIKIVEHDFGIDNFFDGMMLSTATALHKKWSFPLRISSVNETIETFETFLLEELKSFTEIMQFFD